MHAFHRASPGNYALRLLYANIRFCMSGHLFTALTDRAEGHPPVCVADISLKPRVNGISNIGSTAKIPEPLARGMSTGISIAHARLTGRLSLPKWSRSS